MITFRKVKFDALKDIWNSFVLESGYHQPYQEYELNNVIRNNYIFFTLKEFEIPVFYLFEDEGKPICIAPMCVRLFDKNKRVSFGKAPTIPVKDFIYGKSMTIETMVICLKMLVDKFEQIRFYDVPTYSLLYKALESMTDSIKKHVYTSIYMGDGYEKYYESLDKHMRQNIRTPYNRIIKDNVKLDMQIIKGANLDAETESEVNEVYLNRRENHSKYDSLVHKLFLRKMHYFSIGLKKLDSGLFGILKINGKVAAFWSGFKSIDGTYVSCPRLAINEDFKYYSPGILLLCETAKLLYKDWNIKTLDLSRGNHEYKMRMGGAIITPLIISSRSELLDGSSTKLCA